MSVAALDGGDFAAASDLQVALTTYDWDENSTWIVRRVVAAVAELREYFSLDLRTHRLQLKD